ncbi:threonylcarbamoyl-AMP synthase [Dictyobacter sp. S3.2.2.5]|uniref:Threonylcarbamoyl-AMP synthase n=1 Tax=Dictyobacter halimunensis TaxID=3026934 RepID=A0ABQ6FS97_9CHLR|nr:threonylcarbamoyl-AMP synthase [Dictyobacter sp. S3.2.2.5]
MQQRETQIIQLDPNHLDEPYARQQVEYAARLLQEGELVVLPTETVYGLGANAFNAQAAEQIFIAKGRPLSDPLIVHIADEHELENIVSVVPEAAKKLAAAFWPGPLTMILPAGPRVPGLITSGLPNVAVRMPSHPIARALIRAAGVPVAAPSANRFMHVSPTTARHAYMDLKGRVPLILDGGPCTVGVESTILDLCAEVPTILRPGGTGLEALRRVLQKVQPPQLRQIQSEEEEDLTQAQAAPGQMRVHYSPHVPTYLFEGSVEDMRHAMLAELQARQAREEHVGVLIADEDLNAFQESGAIIYSLGHTPEQAATRLFAGLRTLEDAGVNVILCRSFTEQGLGLAIRDRLLKAAGGKITKV